MNSLSLNKIASKSRASRKRERERMVRPKSLNSKIPTSDMTKSKYPELLSHENEGHLTYCIRKLRLVVRIRDDLVASHPNPHDTEMPWQPSETEWAVACGMSVLQLRKTMREGKEARTELVAANGGLVKSIAKKNYWSVKQANQAGGGLGSILTLQDLVQEGNLGLMEAAERFEPERGYRFSTYATYWVRQRILRSISESSRVIRLPAHGK
jgi:DNA-directed RNA polymerase sigma subunit (sigma70/sigma32)